MTGNELPGDGWGVLGLLVLTLGAQANNFFTGRRRLDSQTEQIIGALREDLSDVRQDVADVSDRLDEHIEATNGRVRTSGRAAAEAVPLRRGERRRPRRKEDPS